MFALTSMPRRMLGVATLVNAVTNVLAGAVVAKYRVTLSDVNNTLKTSSYPVPSYASEGLHVFFLQLSLFSANLSTSSNFFLHPLTAAAYDVTYPRPSGSTSCFPIKLTL